MRKQALRNRLIHFWVIFGLPITLGASIALFSSVVGWWNAFMSVMAFFVLVVGSIFVGIAHDNLEINRVRRSDHLREDIPNIPVRPTGGFTPKNKYYNKHGNVENSSGKLPNKGVI